MTIKSLKRKVKVEVNDGPYLCDGDSYVPTKVRVEQYIAAGMRLDEINRDMMDDFDSSEEAEEGYMNPSRRPGFDPADLTDAENKRSEIKEALKKAVEKTKGAEGSKVPSAAGETPKS